MQDNFYDNVVNNRDSKHRYFAIPSDWIGQEDVLIGMAGLTNIEWENGCAEISLIINPKRRGKGYGKKAVDLLLDEAFSNMRLSSVFGEVYECGNKGFWETMVRAFSGYRTSLVDRKYYNGQMFGSMWFSFSKEKYK